MDRICPTITTSFQPRLGWGLLLASSLIGLIGCTHHARTDDKQVIASTQIDRSRYAVQFTANRLQDHILLAEITLPLTVGRKATVRMKRTSPTEQIPAFSAFSATLSTTRSPGQFQLITKVELREAARNKKGKLKVSRRNEGALLPIQPGATQLASAPSDPVQINVRLERR